MAAGSDRCILFALTSSVHRPVEKTGQIHSDRSEEHTSELQSQSNLVCRLLLEKKKKRKTSLSSLGSRICAMSQPRNACCCTRQVCILYILMSKRLRCCSLYTPPYA